MATTNGHAPALGSRIVSQRFSDIPSAIDIPVQGEDDDQAVEVDLEDLLDDPTELCTLLENEGAARTYWMTVSLAYAKQKKVDHAIEMLLKGGQAMKGGQKEKLSLLSCLCWMYLWKSRESPRIPPDGAPVSEAKTKEYYLQLSTSTLNEALRINPAFPPLFLARGVLLLLKASLQPPSKSPIPGAIEQEKTDLLRASLKSFDDAIRVSQGRNMMAVLGKSRALFSLAKWADALEGYQEVLHKMPELIDPDPRIGIGCCFWQLGFKEDAKLAWERSLEINPDSKIANILLGLFYLDASAHVSLNGPEFLKLYKTAMTQYTQKAFKADKEFPLTCATFAGYFLSRKAWPTVETLSHKAIQYTDVNAIASDGWYLLARKEHYENNHKLARDYYERANEARGGIESGYLPAKFGAAQLAVLKADYSEAKLRLEKIIQQSKNIEAMTLLGTIFAEEVFWASSAPGLTKEDKSAEWKKAVGHLENVRNAWKDPKKNLIPDASVLLNLARLYENEQPDKSLQCLQQVEQLEFDQIPEADKPKDAEAEAALRTSLREGLPPQLLNNMGCFYYQGEKYDQSRDMFQAALNACVKAGEKEEEMDTDSLVTTISFNLGRTYEALGLLDEARTVYEGLLKRHSDYTDARTRIAYIAIRQSPKDEGAKVVGQLYQDVSDDLEVRALYGWYLGKQQQGRKRAQNIAEDPEMRHYKHTLQRYEKHDRYALIGMGNLYLLTAREMRRDSEQDKQRRSNTYVKAVEFFDKALQLDPKNAYAAQGIAIALVEDKKDYKTALSIFMKVRDTVRDTSVYINLGHIFAELRQFSKAIEHYEIALAKDRSNDATILACLGRTWLSKAKAEKSLSAFKSCLDYSQKALAIAPEHANHFRFNVAFVQIQLASMVIATSEVQRTTAEVEAATADLHEAIASLDAIAREPNPPYPKHEIEQRANMARNTLRQKLITALGAQKEYEERNKEKLQAAKERREAELKKREEAKRVAEEAEQARKQKIADERKAIAEQDRLLAEQRFEEDRVREEKDLTTDEETGEKVKRKKKARAPGGKRKKKGDEGSDGDEPEEPKKKRRLGKKGEGSKKAAGNSSLSTEIVVESDSEDDNGVRAAMEAEKEEMDTGASEGEPENVPKVKRRDRRARIEESDEDDDEGGQGKAEDSPQTAVEADEDTPMEGVVGDDDDDE